MAYRKTESLHQSKIAGRSVTLTAVRVHALHPRIDLDLVPFLILRNASTVLQAVLLSYVALSIDSHASLPAAGKHFLVLEEHVRSVLVRSPA